MTTTDRKERQARLEAILKKVRRLVVLNFKGGVGKSTIAINTAAYLASKGYKVWLVDLDLQCNATLNFVRPLPRKTMVDVLYDKLNISDIVKIVRPNLWLFPCGLNMSDASTYVQTKDGGTKELDSKINDLLLAGGLPDESGQLQLPDFILFDTASDNGATTSAFRAASEVVIPIKYEFFSFMGIKTMFKVLGKKMEALNHEVEITAVVPNTVNDRRKNVLEYYRSLRNDDELKDAIFPSIHTDVAFDEAQKAGKSIFEFAPRSKGAMEIERVIQCLLKEYDIEQYLKDLDNEAKTEEATEPQQEIKS